MVKQNTKGLNEACHNFSVTNLMHSGSLVSKQKQNIVIKGFDPCSGQTLAGFF